LDCKSDERKLFLPRIKSLRDLIDENPYQYNDIPKKYKNTPTGDLFVLHDLGFNDLRGIVLMGTLSLFYLKAATFG
jgi:hypothetical protein